jgi:hypothetical protein
MKTETTARSSGVLTRSVVPVMALAISMAGCSSDGSSLLQRLVGGEVTGLADGGSLTIAEGNTTLDITENGAFAFPGGYRDGESYDVSIQTYPDGQGCEVSNGSGTVEGSSVSNIGIYCFDLPELTAVSGIMEMSLRWSGPDSVDILYSSDRDCDWDNYSVCADAGMMPDVSGDELVLGSVEHDFAADTGWYFVAERAGFRSPLTSARPVPIGFDRSIWDMTIHENSLIVGGEFMVAGMAVGGGGVATSDSGHVVGPLPEITNWVYDVLPDDDDGWFIGGDFTSIGGVPRQFIARVRADGTLDPEWQVSFEGDWIWRMARDGDRLFVVGSFTEVNGEPRSNIAAFSISGNGELDDFAAPTFDNQISTLTISNDTVYVGGYFEDVGGSPREGLAALDSTTGDLDSNWTPSVDSGGVFDMILYDDHVYLGGGFSEINGSPRRLGRVDTDTGILDADFDPGMTDQTNRLLIDNDTLYIGGNFYEIGGTSRANLAALSLPDHELLDWNPELDDSVWGMAVDGDRLYIGGGFRTANGEPRSYAAAFSTGNEAELIDWEPGATEWLYGLSVQGPNVYLAGASPGGVKRERLAAIELTTGRLTDWAPSASGTVRALAVSDSHLYVGGNFESLNNISRVGIGRFNLSGGELDDWDVESDSSIRAIHIRGNTLYVGGAFTEIAETTRGRAAAFDLGNGTIIGTFEPDINDTVHAITSTDDWLYIGGQFSNVGGEALQSLAAINLATGAPDDSWDAGITWGTVRSLSATNERLYAGGSFSPYNLMGYDLTAAGNPRSSDWQPTVTASPFGLPQVYDIFEWGNRVFIAGLFSEITFTDVESVAAIDRDDGNLLTDWEGSAGRWTTHALLADPERNHLIVGGNFRSLSGHFRHNLGSVDPDTGELIW